MSSVLRSLPLLGVLAVLLSPLAAQQPIHVFFGEGSEPLPGFGYSVGSAGDMDGDGVMDVVAGGPYDGVVPRGRARVFSGATGAQLLPSFMDPVGGHFGFSVAGVGDVNGDGSGDVAVGAPMFGGVGPGGTGFAVIRSGADGSELHRRTGDGASDEFGYSVAGAGDVDLDGFPDWAAGATEDHDFDAGPGYVRIFSGATGAPIRTLTTSGVHGRFGQSLAALDADLDGIADLLVGASGGSRVQMRSGADGSILWQRSSTGYGWGVDLAGDVDADGFLDVVVGAPSAGRARVLRAVDGVLVRSIQGAAADFFGGAVAGLGDVDLDGHDDLAVGAKWADGPVEAFTGAAWIYSGRRSSVLATFSGSSSGDRAGFALAGLGDVNQDGTPDLALGAPQETNAGPGFVAVLSGRPRGLHVRR
jgi:hypothetical protein